MTQVITWRKYQLLLIVVPFNAADVHCRSVPHHRSSKLVFRFTSYDGLSIANYHDHSIANYVYHDQSCANYANPTFASWDDLSFANYDGLNHCKLQAIGFQNKLIFLQLWITFSWVKSGTALHTDPPVISKINILIGPGHNLGAGECRFAGVGRIRSIKKPKS